MARDRHPIGGEDRRKISPINESCSSRQWSDPSTPAPCLRSCAYLLLSRRYLAPGRNECRVSCAAAGLRQSRHGSRTNAKIPDLSRLFPYDREVVAPTIACLTDKYGSTVGSLEVSDQVAGCLPSAVLFHEPVEKWVEIEEGQALKEQKTDFQLKPTVAETDQILDRLGFAGYWCSGVLG